MVTSKIKRSLSQKLATYFPSCCDNEIDNCIRNIWNMAHLYDTRYDMSDREILSSIHIWHMVWRGRTRAGLLYLWCVDIICWEILPFIILFVSIRNLFSCRISHCLLWYRDSWYWGPIYRDIVPINTTVISIKIEIEKSSPSIISGVLISLKIESGLW